jgi:nicotinamide riboside transporter PnuC
MKIFGREPAVWLALVGSIVSVLGAFVVHLTTDQQGVLNAGAALVVGVVVAFLVHDGVSAAVLGLFKGVLAIAVAFGLHLPAEQQAILYSLAAAVVAMFVRTQATAPVAAPVIPVRPELPPKP